MPMLWKMNAQVSKGWTGLFCWKYQLYDKSNDWQLESYDCQSLLQVNEAAEQYNYAESYNVFCDYNQQICIKHVKVTSV